MPRDQTTHFGLSLALLLAACLLLGAVGPARAERPATSQVATLSLGPEVGTIPSTFWATRLYTSPMDGLAVMSDLNSSPFSVVRTGAFCDSSNWTAGITYSSSGTPGTVALNWSQVKVAAEDTGRAFIACVSAEINNAGAAASEVRYIEDTVGFKPAYWDIGNEPEGWTHFNIPWTSWQTSDAKTPTPDQYALLVRNYTSAIRSVDPSARIIGIQVGAAVTQDGPWLNALAAVDGPNITAVGVHMYVDGAGTEVQSETQFLSGSNLSKIVTGLAYDRANLTAGCGSCTIPIWIDEFNAYSSSCCQVNPYPTTYAMVPYTAAGIIEALDGGASQFLFFDFYGRSNYSLVNSSSGSARPAYYLFSDLISLLPSSGTVYNVSATGGATSLYAVAYVSRAGAISLILVNANLTASDTVDLGVGFRGTSASFSAYALSPSAPFTVADSSGQVNASFSLPPLTVEVVSIPAPAGPTGLGAFLTSGGAPETYALVASAAIAGLIGFLLLVDLRASGRRHRRA